MFPIGIIKKELAPILILSFILIILVGIVSPYILISLIILFMVFAIIKDFRIGTILIIILSFTNFAGQQMFESLHLMLLTTAITLFSFTLSYLHGNIAIKTTPKINRLFIIFGLWSFASGIIAFDHKLWYQNIELFLRAIIVFYLVINSFSSIKDIMFLFKVIVLSVFMSSIISFYAEYGIIIPTLSTLFHFFLRRFAGSILDPNYFSMTVAGTLPLVIILMKRENLLMSKLFWLSIALFLIFCIVVSQSRTGLLSSLVVFFYSLYYLIKNKRSEVWFLIIPMILVLILLPVFVWSRLLLFVNNITTGTRSDISTLHRFILLESAFDVFIKHPITGVGLGNFEFFAAQYTQYPMVCHNTYLEIAANLGLPGLIIFLTIIYKTFSILHQWGLRKHSSDVAWGLKIGLLGFCTSILFLSVPFKLDLWIFLALSWVIDQTGQKEC